MSAQLVGSRISLISKKDIRYEGVLYTIDTENSSVTLQNVKSWGTEGRGAGEQIAPNDELFSCIVFRGQDIKDLHVHDTSPDEDSHLHASQTQNQPPLLSPPKGVTSGHVSPPPPPPPQAKGKQQGKQQQPREPKDSSNSSSKAHANARDSSTSTNKDKDKEKDKSKDAAGGKDAGAKYQPPHKNPNYKGSRGTGGRGAPPGPSGGPPAIPGMGDHLKSRRTRGGGGIDVETEEFDFQAALAKFDKEAEKEEIFGTSTATDTSSGDAPAGGEGAQADGDTSGGGDADKPAVPAVKKYNKSSFFDEISCDALDGRHRVSNYSERGLNTETFGATSLAFGGPRRFGSGRGRGGFRGRGRGDGFRRNFNSSGGRGSENS